MIRGKYYIFKFVKPFSFSTSSFGKLKFLKSPRSLASSDFTSSAISFNLSCVSLSCRVFELGRWKPLFLVWTSLAFFFTIGSLSDSLALLEPDRDRAPPPLDRLLSRLVRTPTDPTLLLNVCGFITLSLCIYG